MEIRGRLWLWEQAVTQCQIQLGLAERAATGLKDENIKHRELLYCRAQQKYAEEQADYEPGILKQSHLAAFRVMHPQTFPTSVDCHLTISYCVMLSVVLFSQMFNSGYKETGAAAENNKNFRSTHFENIASRVFPLDQDRTAFMMLCSEIISARDTMIGHADAKAFEIVHGTPISKMNGFEKAIQRIDRTYWFSILDRLRRGIREYSNSITTC